MAAEPIRVAPRLEHTLPWYLKPFFWAQRRRYGKALDAALVWARAPKLFLGVALLYGMIDRRGSPLTPALRSLLTVRVSQINHCPFCVDINSATLLQRGVSEEKVLALMDWRTSNLFDSVERAALDYAEAMTRSGGGVDDAHLNALRPHLDEEAIVELTGLIAFQNLSSKFNAALAVPPQGFCALPVPAAAPAEPHQGR